MPTRRALSNVWTVRTLLACLLAGVTALAGATAGNQDAADRPTPPRVQPPPAEFECRWAAGPLTPNGKGDDEAWKHAQAIDHFHLPWLGARARAAKTATRAKLL